MLSKHWTSQKQILAKRLALAFLSGLVGILSGPVFAQKSCGSLFMEPPTESEISTGSQANNKNAKMRLAIETNGQVKKGSGKYITTRGWEVYRETLMAKKVSAEKTELVDFATTIFKDLKSDDVILDAGCGDGYLSDVLFENKGEGPYRDRAESSLPHYVGITYALNLRSREFFSEREKSGRFQMHTGDFFEQVQFNSLIPRGKTIKVIADYYGILSYTERPDLILKQYFELLDAKGTLIIAGRAGIAFSRSSKVWDLLGYLKMVSGIEISFINSFETAIVVKPTGEPIRIPELELSNVRDVGVLPYIRTFRFTGRSLDVGQ